jgi:hypothetical protein
MITKLLLDISSKQIGRMYEVTAVVYDLDEAPEHVFPIDKQVFTIKGASRGDAETAVYYVMVERLKVLEPYTLDVKADESTKKNLNDHRYLKKNEPDEYEIIMDDLSSLMMHNGYTIESYWISNIP